MLLDYFNEYIYILTGDFGNWCLTPFTKQYICRRFSVYIHSFVSFFISVFNILGQKQPHQRSKVKGHLTGVLRSKATAPVLLGQRQPHRCS